MYPPPFQVTICKPPQLSQGTVGGPFPIPVIGNDFRSGCFDEFCVFEDKASFKDWLFGCGGWLVGGRVLYLAESIDKTRLSTCEKYSYMSFEKG